ncbi:hypothetical protein HHL19_35830 [Streptomyces sp. R302]|uniref:hypothetical protein n=1 Tax=unclassified Streptomyces TaxID=2593676 RepID=UPI00145E819F|nr:MULTISPECIES: hypothetical protein [unclassified Streptomyces]NML55089.1 hypothetical protein [Streptomyces sp. R301]NML83881.1 hypothetical protein [Streptomyces sp. R302]
MSKSIDEATRTIHLQGIGRVPAAPGHELIVGDQLMYNGGGVCQITKIVAASPQFLLITEMNTETGEENSRRVKKTRMVARVPETARRALGFDAPATDYSAQVRAPEGDEWVTVGHGATAEEAISGLTPSKQVPTYFGTVMLDRHGLGYTAANPDGRARSVQAMMAGETLTAADGHSFRILPPEQPEPAAAAEETVPAVPFTVGSALLYVPEDGMERDVVLLNSGPDGDGTVEVLSVKQGGKPLRVPLAMLKELPELPPAPEGVPTDYWTVTDKDGQQVTLVRAETLEGARGEVEKDPQAAAVARRLGGLSYRRLRTSELPPEIRAAVEADIAGRDGRWAVMDRAGNLITTVQATSYNHAVQVADQDPTVQAASPGSGGLIFMRARVEEPAPAPRVVSVHQTGGRTVTVTAGFTRKSIPTRLRESGAPGEMVNGSTGALRWRLPNGEELTPGEAAKRFLGDA